MVSQFHIAQGPRLDVALVASLDVESTAAALTLAAQHSLCALKAAAMALVLERGEEVMATEGWTHLEHSRPEVSGERVGLLSACNLALIRSGPLGSS